MLAVLEVRQRFGMQGQRTAKLVMPPGRDKADSRTRGGPWSPKSATPQPVIRGWHLGFWLSIRESEMKQMLKVAQIT